MNCYRSGIKVSDGTMQPYLHNEDDVIENAIRTAINTVINVICAANRGKILEYQRMVEDRDMEIRRLECKLEKSEDELKILHLTMLRDCELPKKECCAKSGSTICTDNDNEMTIGPECEIKLSCVGAKNPPQVSLMCPDTDPHALTNQQICTDSDFFEAPGLSEGPGGQSSLDDLMPVVKEEPSDIETVIKWEVCDHSLGGHQEAQGVFVCPHKENPGRKRRFNLSGAQRSKKYRERIRADPERLRVFKEKERLRKMQTRARISELPKETQRLKRAAWRAATRRCRARKKALAHPTQPCYLPQNTDSPQGSIQHKSRPRRGGGQLHS